MIHTIRFSVIEKKIPRQEQTYMTILTTMVRQSDEASTESRAWTVAEAKAKLSEVIEQAITKGPQTITRHGKKAVCVVSVEEWERKTKRVGSLADFFSASPMGGETLKIDRMKDAPSEIEL